jgi:hypothetical protein
MHIATYAVRPGSAAFARVLELKYYRPGTPRNDQFNISFIRDFGGPGMPPWVVIHIPLIDRTIAEQVAKETGMKLADGLPFIFSGNERHEFPLQERVLTLENAPSSKVYDGPDGVREIEEQGAEMIRVLEAEQAEWMRKTDKHWYAGVWWYRAKGENDPMLERATHVYRSRDDHFGTGAGVLWWTDSTPQKEWLPGT